MKNILGILGVLLIVAITVAVLFPTETQAQLGKVYSVFARKIVVSDSVRFTSGTVLMSSSFVGDSVVKTIAISGGQTTDKYFVTYTGAPGDSTIGTPTTTAFTGAVQVKRQTAHAEANQAFVILRLK